MMAKKKKNTRQKRKIKKFLFTILILLILAAIGYFGKDYVFLLIQPTEEISHTPTTVLNGITYEPLQIYFLELGAYNTGDATYIKAGDTDILIDAGSTQSSAETIQSFVNQHCTDGILEYVITTHAHSDHYTGMFGNTKTSDNKAPKNFQNEPVARTGILYYYQIGTIIDFSLTNQNQDATFYNNYLNAVEYAKENGAIHYQAHECFNELNGAKSQYVLDEEHQITLEILYNRFYFETSSDENNYSVCSMIQFQDHHFLFTGDLEKEGEEAMAAYYDRSTPEKTLPHVDLFKAGHHGSKTSSNDCLLSLITPDICCVCCCAGGSEYTTNSANTFPTQDFIDRIAKYTDQVYVTSLIDEQKSRADGKLSYTSFNGNICISCDGVQIGLACSNHTTKLKDSEWFNETIYLDTNGNICSGNKGSTSFYTQADENVTASPRRTWPES